MTISSISSSLSGLNQITGASYQTDASVSDVAAQGQGLDDATFSKGAQQMNQLHQLQTSDPEKFKQAAQAIADKLTEKASEATDSTEADAMKDMAAKWSEAAESGNMDSLKPQAPPSGSQAQKAAMKFKAGGDTGGPMATMDSVISGVFSDLGISTTSSGTSSSGASVSNYYSVASSSETAA